jgi:O-antigen ligase
VRSYSFVPASHDKIIYNKNNSSWNDYYNTNKTIFINSRLVKDQSTSGRVNIWITVINKYDKNKIFGYGPQADRFLLLNLFDKQGWGTNASNALIYSFACGGYIALLIFIIINFKILYNLYICFFKKKIFGNNQFTYIKLATAYILFFWIRSVIENSFAVFSIDFLLFSCSYLAIENFLKKKY